ncbi:hypothetical protein BZG36_04790 [Bifiguratus adelaidae]|uniref:Myb-like domain-containing protein n=1 Tax=Bifiguratus adelaidae TaxID=1938954 RepID=A0A261XTX9_9FUNG|nr:hypothetical protein BZG36_04790 [Bifiguratus adelaidae]
MADSLTDIVVLEYLALTYCRHELLSTSEHSESLLDDSRSKKEQYWESFDAFKVNHFTHCQYLKKEDFALENETTRKLRLAANTATLLHHIVTAQYEEALNAFIGFFLNQAFIDIEQHSEKLVDLAIQACLAQILDAADVDDAVVKANLDWYLPTTINDGLLSVFMEEFTDQDQDDLRKYFELNERQSFKIWLRRHDTDKLKEDFSWENNPYHLGKQSWVEFTEEIIRQLGESWLENVLPKSSSVGQIRRGDGHFESANEISGEYNAVRQELKESVSMPDNADEEEQERDRHTSAEESAKEDEGLGEEQHVEATNEEERESEYQPADLQGRFLHLKRQALLLRYVEANADVLENCRDLIESDRRPILASIENEQTPMKRTNGNLESQGESSNQTRYKRLRQSRVNRSSVGSDSGSKFVVEIENRENREVSEEMEDAVDASDDETFVDGPRLRKKDLKVERSRESQLYVSELRDKASQLHGLQEEPPQVTISATRALLTPTRASRATPSQSSPSQRQSAFDRRQNNATRVEWNSLDEREEHEDESPMTSTPKAIKREASSTHCGTTAEASHARDTPRPTANGSTSVNPRQQQRQNHPSTNGTTSSNRPKEKYFYKIDGPRRRWTNDEMKALEEGMRQFGTSWKDIALNYGSNSRDKRLAGRHVVQLKDKARNEKQRRQKAGEDLGVWAIACG